MERNNEEAGECVMRFTNEMLSTAARMVLAKGFSVLTGEKTANEDRDASKSKQKKNVLYLRNGNFKPFSRT